MFVVYSPNDDSETGTVNRLLEDGTGAVWCAAGRGLYRLEQMNGHGRFEWSRSGFNERLRTI